MLKLYPAHRLARLSYQARAFSFGFVFLVLGLLAAERGYGALMLACGALQFLLYPHLAYLRTRLTLDSKQAELDNQLADALMLGIWAAQIDFALWPVAVLLMGTAPNSAVNGGMRRFALSMACFAAGALVWSALRGFPFRPDTNSVTSAFCLLGILGYTAYAGVVLWQQNQNLLRTREALRISEEHFRFIAEHAGDLVATLDARGGWLYSSPSYRDHFNEADLQVQGDAFSLIHVDDRAAVRAAFAKMVASGEGELLRYRMTAKDGRAHIIECESNPVCETPGRVSMVIMVSRDITTRVKAEINLRLAAHAFNSLVDGVLITEADGRIDYVNRAYSQITGYDPGEVVGRNINELKSGLQPDNFYNEIWDSVDRTGGWQGRMWKRRKNGTMFAAWMSVSAVKGDDGVVSHYVWIMRETTRDYRLQTA